MDLPQMMEDNGGLWMKVTVWHTDPKLPEKTQVTKHISVTSVSLKAGSQTLEITTPSGFHRYRQNLVEHWELEVGV